MTSPNGAMIYTQGFGSRPENVEIPIIQTRAPTAQDTQNGFLPLGKRWVDKTNNAEYVLTSYSSITGALLATWSLLGSSVGSLSVLGTANQVTATTVAGVTTLTIPTTFTSPGSVTATLGNITATNGNIVRGTAGNKDVYSSVATTTTAGANSAGTVSLASGVAIVATTAVTANSIIRLYRQGIGTTGSSPMGFITLFAKTAGVSFEIRAVDQVNSTATETTDNSVIAWEIVN